MVKKKNEVSFNGSSLVIGVFLNASDSMIEGSYWLQAVNNVHYINLAHIDATLKESNLIFQWLAEVLYLRTDSIFVYHWISCTLTG